MSLAVARRVALVEDEDGTAYAALVPDGVPVVLAGSARLIWDAVVGADGGVERAAVTAGVAAMCGVDPSDIDADVSAFLDALLDQGLLEER